MPVPVLAPARAAEDGAQHAAHDLSTDFRSNGARCAFDHRFSSGLPVRTALAEHTTEHIAKYRPGGLGRRYGCGRSGCGVRLLAALFEYFVGRFAIHHLLIDAGDV